MNPKDFLAVAMFLSKGSSEAAIRSLVSRAYYAMLIYIREIMVNELHIQFLDGQNIHEWIPRYLKYSQLPDAKDLSKKINDFRDMRNCADYDMIQKFTEMDKLWLQRSEKIIAHFDKLDKRKLQAGILTYLRIISEPKRNEPES